MIHRIFTFLLVALALTLVGCVNLKPQPDRTQLYLLAGNVSAPLDLSGKPPSYVARIDLPGYLAGNRIYYRSANGTLAPVVGARWADALAEALPQALAMHLQATGWTQVQGYYPSSNPVADRATVAVRFERFSARPDGQVEVVAQWEVVHPDRSLDSGRYVSAALLWDGVDPGAYVAHLDTALSGLAEAIADSFRVD